jgi:pyruvate dehydrogenase E1 component beta subunit
MDTDAVVRSVRKTHRVLIVEEAHGTAGLAAEIGFRVFEHAFDVLDAPIRRVAGLDVPVPASPALEQAALPDRHRILQAALDLATT